MSRRILLVALASAVLVLGGVGLWSHHQDGERDAHLERGRALLATSFAEAPELHDLPAGDALAAFEAAEALGAAIPAERASAEALAFLQAGDLVSSAGALREAKRPGWTARLRLVAAAIAASRGHEADAREHVNEALILSADGDDPADHRRALLFAGDLALDASESRSARDAFAELAELEPEVAAVHNRLGLALEGLGEWEPARDAVRRAVSLDPELTDGWINRGRQARALGELDEAAEAFEHATELAPARSDAWLGFGLSALDRGDPAAARPALERASELAPESVDASLALADLLAAEGRLDEAADAYRLTLRDNLHHAAGWVKLGNVLFALGEKADAAFAHRRALERDPSLAAAHNGLGAALIGIDDDAAQAALRTAAELDAADPHPLMNLALLAERRGDRDAARDAWQRAAERDPDSLVVAERLAALR
ncbi:MAG: tetratricopeptide repeat protein [Deltaproteobacteria bacterium]|nr:tetratricopeptide repeat protein [Deltaproteobacteria bacterium]